MEKKVGVRKEEEGDSKGRKRRMGIRKEEEDGSKEGRGGWE